MAVDVLTLIFEPGEIDETWATPQGGEFQV